jgi:prohibitin 2
MNSQDAFRRFAQQIQRAGGQGGGGGLPGGPGRLLAGGGLVVALIGGGIILNASLFNGTLRPRFVLSEPQC